MEIIDFYRFIIQARRWRSEIERRSKTAINLAVTRKNVEKAVKRRKPRRIWV